MTINQEKTEEEWLINCLKFAPNAPKQNPVEDIWLQAKNFNYIILSYLPIIFAVLLTDIPQIFIYLYLCLHFQRDLYEKPSF